MDFLWIFQNIKRLFTAMRGRRALFVIGSMLALGRLGISFIMPYLYQLLINLVGEGVAADVMLRQVSLPFALLLVIAPLVCLGGYWQKRSANYATAQMQKQVFDHVVRMPVSEMETGRADKLLRATENVKRATGLFGGYSMTYLFRFAIYGIGGLILLLVADWRFALAGVGVGALVFVISTFLNVRLRALEVAAAETDAKAAGHLMALVTNLQIVKLYLLGEPLTEAFYGAGYDAYQMRLSYKRMRGITDGAVDFLSFVVQPLALAIGVQLVSGGRLPFAQLVYIAGLLDIMLLGVHELGQFFMVIQQSVANGQRVFEMLDMPEEADRPSAGNPNRAAECAVALEKVAFTYTEDRTVLKDVSLEIKSGQMTALVGPSGSGKSTLIKLLEGFYEPESGKIRIFGVDSRQLSLELQRRMFAYIPQDAALFDGTVEENIRLSRPGCTDAQLQAAIQGAALGPVLEALPEGARTMVGEGGARLSGGQRQRVAIARALLTDAPVYLLDEATSALDIATEKEIQATFESSLKGRTVVCVAHRLSTIENADVIVYMEAGEILETGTHAELMARKGGYYRLHEAQRAA